MKKIILTSMMLLSAFPSADAQDGIYVDDAVQGTGNNQHQYVGTWRHNTTTPTFYNSTLSYSNQTGAYITITFTGKGLAWYTEEKNTHGIVAVSIDGGPETMIDLYSEITRQQVRVFSRPTNLQQGTHTFKIRVTGTKNPASTGYYAIHDYLFIYEGSNTSFGLHALSSGGDNSSAFGYNAITGPLQGGRNTGIGAWALAGMDKGGSNTGVGFQALLIGADGLTNANTAVGARALARLSGEANTAVGFDAGPGETLYLNNTIALGARTRVTAHHQARIGNPYVTSIGGQVSWSTLSDGRFKTDLKEDVPGLKFINELRPVSYIVDKDGVAKFLGITDSRQGSKPVRETGFIAQEVEALVKKSGYIFYGVQAPKNDLDPYTIRYEEFVVPLVKAVQELALSVEKEQKEIDELLTTSAEALDMLSVAEVAELYQNNPGNFSSDTNIGMSIPESANQVQLVIYTLDGKQIKNFSVKQRGQTSVTLSGNLLDPGMYLYRLVIDDKIVDTKRMILME